MRNLFATMLGLVPQPQVRIFHFDCDYSKLYATLAPTKAGTENGMTVDWNISHAASTLFPNKAAAKAAYAKVTDPIKPGVICFEKVPRAASANLS